jgi:hypothetical protein
MKRALTLVVLLAPPAFGQQAPDAPSVEVAVDPEGPVIVGTPVEISLTVLVPTYMPDPPVWPDLQIADAITRLPERATHPVTRRSGGATLSGLTRTYEVVPQRAADYDLTDATVVVTYADPETNAPRQANLPVPGFSVSATIPEGAGDLDPFLAAASLGIEATLEGLPDHPKPGDSFSLTLTATASGPPAMLLPPLAAGLPTPAGLRAYPRQPALADTPATGGGPAAAARKETIAYVIEEPGHYVLPAVSIDWWNLSNHSVETSSTSPVTIEVPAPPGWRDDAPGTALRRPRNLLLVVAGLGLAAGVVALVWRWALHRARQPASERRLYRELVRSVRRDPPETIRSRVTSWLGVLSPADPTPVPDIEKALLALERTALGPAPDVTSVPSKRRSLLSILHAHRRAYRPRARRDGQPFLQPLNPGFSPRRL